MTRSPWEQDLIRLCEAVRFDATDRCSFAGRLLELDAAPDAASARTASGEGTEPAGGNADRLLAALRQAIYLHGYCRQFTGSLPEPSPVYDPDFVPDTRLAEQLSEANQSRSGWDPGWEICRIGVERDVQVRNGDRYCTVPAGQYSFSAGPGMVPQVGDYVSLQVLRESSRIQPGMYFVFGETLGDQYDAADCVRFYFHLDPPGAPRLVELLTTILNRFQIPFEFKCQKYRENYDRLDAAVLYIARRYFDVVSRLVQEVAAGIQEHLRPAVPLLTRQVQAGIGVADDPGGNRSFGQDRCNLIATAMLEVRRDGQVDPREFLAALEHGFASRGASLARPYLNPGRVDLFDTASEPVGTSRTGVCSVNAVTEGNVEAIDFLETADRIAHRIARDAMWAADACTWLGWTSERGMAADEILFATVGSDLYGGTAGISLFLTRYFQLRPSRQIEIVLRGAVQHALVGLLKMPASRTGLFDGAAGICLAVIEAGAALADGQLVERGLAHLSDVGERAPASEAIDVIDGSAGLIPVLLDAALRFNRTGLLAAAVRHGEHLLQHADKSDDGWSWPTMRGWTQRHATGYAHGAAGIAIALLELFQQTGDERFLLAARQGWRYERSHFCPQQNNWPDFRYAETSDEPQCATAWCHGSAGIGISRLRGWELGHRDDELAGEIEASLTSTRARLQANGQGSADFSPCHGMAGNAELFIAAAQILDRPELHQVAAEVGQRGLCQYERQGQPWPCGGTDVGETPGLMLGLAGIGLFYLRLHAPGRVDSPLLVRPPRKGGDHSADAAPRQ